MKIFLLAGQSFSNKEWIEEVEKEFKKDFSSIEVMYYEHWYLGKKEIDFEGELKKFVDLVSSCDEDYVVFAKSVGTLLFFKSLEKNIKRPKGVLMVGLAYLYGKENGINLVELSKLANFKINIYQKEFDPAGKFKDIKILENGNIKVKKYECVGEKNDNHYYGNFEYLGSLMKF
jgi:hypothetical protein